MRRTLPWLLLGSIVGCAPTQGGTVGPAGPAGPKGDKGDPGVVGAVGDGGTSILDPSISAINPPAVLGARQATVMISGANTHFKNGVTTIDFGDPGITASMPVVGSATNLSTTLTISPQALIGPHNVVINTPGAGAGGTAEMLTLQSGLTVQRTLYSELPTGQTMAPKASQGGLVQVQLRNEDYRNNPFDPLTVRPASGIASLYALASPPVSTINTTTFGTFVLVDALATAGVGLPMALSTLSPLGTPILYVSDGKDTLAPQVTATTPVVVNVNATVGGQAFNTTQTVLYKYTSAAADTVIQLNLSALGTGLLPGVTFPRVQGYLAPMTGRFADGLPIDTSTTFVTGVLQARNAVLYLKDKGDYYFSLWTDNLSTSAQHTYSVLIKSAAGTTTVLKEPAGGDSVGTPLANLSLAQSYFAPIGTAAMPNGAIDTVGDIDYIKFTAAKNGRVLVTAQTPNGEKIGVGIFDSTMCMTAIDSATTVTASGAASQEAAVNAGVTYCAKITAPLPTRYQLQISQDL